jgi:quinol monooxygenase YgiN
MIPRIVAAPLENWTYLLSRNPMTANLLTLINIFKVQPSDQQRLIDLLTQATENSVKNATGFISARLHRSIDGTKVTMYAQWRSRKDYEAMRSDPAPLPYLNEALKIATFEPGMYEIVQEFRPGG